MTKEEILAMEAGRKLDGLIAKDIMSIDVEYPFAEGYPYYLTEDKKGKKVWDIVALYSTDISAAWQVVEKMFADGFHVTIMTIYIHQPNPKYKVLVSRIVRIGHLNDIEIESETAPVAICKAALLAKLKGGRNEISME